MADWLANDTSSLFFLILLAIRGDQQQWAPSDHKAICCPVKSEADAIHKSNPQVFAWFLGWLVCKSLIF